MGIVDNRWTIDALCRGMQEGGATCGIMWLCACGANQMVRQCIAISWVIHVAVGARWAVEDLFY